MTQKQFSIDHISAVLYGEPSQKAYLFIHGQCGCKEEGLAFTKIACRWTDISLRANSIGAHFSMLAFASEELHKALFVSPVVNMERLIADMMQWAGVTEQELVIGQSSFTGEGNIQREFVVALYSFSTDTTAGGRASLRMVPLVFGVLSCSTPFTS